MVEAVGSGSIGPAVVQTTHATAPAPSTAKAGASASQQAAATSPASEPMSPRATPDPLAGAVITEYLNGSGDITMQVPSSAAVAYMRMGLEADGRPQPDESSVLA